MSFADIRDQSTPIRFLENMLRSKRMANGLLFWGPEGVGKRMTAVELAKAVNCSSGQPSACGTCLSCRKVAHGNHPDVKIVSPSGKSRNISVETIDSINELAAYRPFEGTWRVIMFDDVHRMGEAAQNHFLKTLEEPPSMTMFVLVTPSPRLLLPTIRSRCQQVRFGALRPETVAELLRKGHDLPEETALALAAVAQGQMSRALDLVVSGKRDAVLHVLEELAGGADPMAMSETFAAHVRQRQEALRAALKAEAEAQEEDDSQSANGEDAKLEQDAAVEAMLRRDLMEYLYLMLVWCRDEWVYRAAGGMQCVLNRDQAARLEKSPAAAGPTRLEAIDKAWLYIERNLSVERVFRDLFFKLAPRTAS